jgi:3-hydroxyacyl-CoA dehydrogenase
MLVEQTKEQQEQARLAFAEQEKAAQKLPGHKYRKLTSVEVAEKIKEITDNKEIHDMVDQMFVKVANTCDEIAMYVESVPRHMNIKNQVLEEVFEQIAESIRDIPDGPRCALQRACNARYDAARIPELGSEIRRAGYEEGYRE